MLPFIKSRRTSIYIPILGGVIGVLLGLLFFSPLHMVLSDYIHAKFPHEHLMRMLHLRSVSISELFTKEAFLWNIYFASLSGIVGFLLALLYARVLTDKRKIEESRNELNAILSHIIEGVVVEDKDYTIRFMNDSFKRLYGDQIGRKCYEVFHNSTFPCDLCAIDEVINKNKECVCYNTTDSEGREYEVTAAPLIFKDETLVVEICRDVTERNRLRKKLFQSDKMITIGQLSAGIAHELRNPLCAIDAARYYISEVIEDKNPELQEELESIERGVKRAQKIINDLLDFSRESAGEREEVDVNDLLENSLSLVKDEMLIRDIELIEKFGDIPHTYINASAMRQAFLNIIVNAIQAMDKFGRLEVTTEVDRSSQSLIRVIISDNGPGIPKDSLSKIFEPFYTTKQDGQGTGLGLAITKSIVERDGGTIIVNSTVGKGTTFTISIPVCESPKCECFPDQRLAKSMEVKEIL